MKLRHGAISTHEPKSQLAAAVLGCLKVLDDEHRSTDIGPVEWGRERVKQEAAEGLNYN